MYNVYMYMYIYTVYMNNLHNIIVMYNIEHLVIEYIMLLYIYIIKNPQTQQRRFPANAHAETSEVLQDGKEVSLGVLCHGHTYVR